jgi:hypothetical protein
MAARNAELLDFNFHNGKPAPFKILRGLLAFAVLLVV